MLQVAGEALLHYANTAHDAIGLAARVLNDPDGHEISLHWAGENRMKKTVMQTAKEIEKTPPPRDINGKLDLLRVVR